MPRFDPHYLIENGDGTRLREAQSAFVNARGHYLGETASFAGTTAAPSTSAEKKALLRKNRALAQREIEKRAPGQVTVNADGSLHLVNPLTPMNRTMADLLRPAHGAIDASPLSSELKTKLKTQPVTFFVDLFDPFLNAVCEALTAVMERGLNRDSSGFKNRTTKDTGALGIGGFVYDLSTPPFLLTLGNPAFKNVNIWLYQPGDDLFDDESQGIILRMRMLLAYFVLFFRKPAELQAALIRKGLEFLFGKPDSTLVRVGTGKDGSSFDKPSIVTSMPMVWRGGTRKEIPAGPYLISKYTTNSTAMLPKSRDLDDVTKLVWEIPQDNRKNQTRSFVQLTQRSWDSWRRQHAQLIASRLSEGRAINGLGSLGTEPATTTTTVVAAKVAADTGTAAGGGEAAAAVIGAWCGGIAGIVTALGGAIAAIILAVNKPDVAAAEAKEAEAQAREAESKAEEGKAAAASSSASAAPLLIGAAAVVALLVYKGSQNRKG